MKNILLIIPLVVSNFSFAQVNYEAFQYESKFGVVDKTTLEEVVPPKYENFAPIFKDVLAFVDKDRFFFFDEKTSETSSYINKNQELWVSNGFFFHFIDKGKSVLISRTKFSNKIFFEKEYKEMKGYKQNVIGFTHSNTIDFFKKDDYTKPYLKDISANFYYVDNFYDVKNDREIFVYIFFGIDSIFVYDDGLNLLYQIPSKETDYKKVLKQIENKFKLGERRGIGTRWSYDKIWKIKQEHDYSVFSIDEYNFSFSIKGVFEESKLSLSKEYIDVINKYDWVVIKDTKSGMEYCFKIDLKKKTFFYPKKYQEQLDLQILD